MAVAGMTASGMVGHLFDLVGEHHYERRDVGFNPAHRAAIMERLSGEPLTELAGMPVRGMDEIDGRRWMLDVGWVAARFSGTEPLLRIYREVDTTPNLGFTQFKRRRQGNLQVGGTERPGVPECRGQRPTVRNLPTPATGGV